MTQAIPDLTLIETPRLILRELSPRVYNHVFSLDETDIRSFFGHNTDEEYKEELRRYTGGMHTFNKSYFIFHILHKESRKVLGSIGYHTWYTMHNRAEIFYLIREESDRRQGYASEAIVPTIAYGFKEMGLQRIEAMLSPQNMASVRLLQKSGFRKEGCLRAHYLVNGEYGDSDIYGLLSKEFTGH